MPGLSLWCPQPCQCMPLVNKQCHYLPIHSADVFRAVPGSSFSLTMYNASASLEDFSWVCCHLLVCTHYVLTQDILISHPDHLPALLLVFS